MKSILIRMAQSLLFILVSVWVLLALLLYLFQPRFVFYPHKTLTLTPQDINLIHEDVTLITVDNIKLHGWYLPHDNPRATLLFLHGNAGNMSHRLESLQIFNALGLSVLIIDYRGYGNSEGNPTETGTYHDADAAWHYLVNKRNLSPDEIIVFGRSLGGAVATWLASRQQPAALILESAFTSIEDMGKHYYPYLPVKWLARVRYPSIDRIKSVKCPLLVIHSPNDDIVPYRFGKELFTAANEPKQFLDIDGGHNEGFLITGNRYVDGLDQFLDTYLE